MAEPEGLLVEGARLATIAARDLWWRLAPPRERTMLPLAPDPPAARAVPGSALRRGAIDPARRPTARSHVGRSPRGARTPSSHEPDCDRRDRRRAHLAPASGRILRGRSPSRRDLSAARGRDGGACRPRHATPRAAQGIRSARARPVPPGRGGHHRPGDRRILSRPRAGPPRREACSARRAPPTRSTHPAERTVERMVRDVLRTELGRPFATCSS
jgi:hypothetical protein